MSTTETPETSKMEERSQPQGIQTAQQESAVTASPVEMRSLTKEAPIGAALDQQETNKSEGGSPMRNRPMRADTTTAIDAAQHIPSEHPPLPSLPAGEIQQQPTAALKETETEDLGPKLMITLLLMSGARHPFNLDAKYLAKRNVQVQGDDPFNLSVYKVKELILREWRDEWEAKPSSPSAIRLISFGKVLDDKSAMKDLRLNAQTANVVHMSIKPQDFVEEEDAKASKADDLKVMMATHVVARVVDVPSCEKGSANFVC